MRISKEAYEDIINKRKDWPKNIDPKSEQQLDLDVSRRLDQPRVIYHITPVPKPRQTQRDKWQKRPPVMRYRAFKDQVREAGIILPDAGFRMIFVLPMPKSWSKKKKDQMRGMPHQSKPDADNLTKSLKDAVYSEDSQIYHDDSLKFWGDSGQIIIERTSKAVRLSQKGIVWDSVA